MYVMEGGVSQKGQYSQENKIGPSIFPVALPALKIGIAKDLFVIPAVFPMIQYFIKGVDANIKASR